MLPIIRKNTAALWLSAVLLCGCSDTSLSSGDMSEYAASADSSDCVSSEGGASPESDGILTITDRSSFPDDADLGAAEYSAICIKKGGSLELNSEINLECDLRLESGGRLIIGENGLISGGGAIIVEGSFDDIECMGRVTARIVPPAPVTENGVTTVGGVLIVNKNYTLPEDYGSELIVNSETGAGTLVDDAYSALVEMREASGCPMPIVSGFRSYDTQSAIYSRYVNYYGEAEANTFSAKPGQSEHQTGLAVDITSLEQDYGETAEGIWLSENCYKFGFIIRYAEEKESVTGYIYEPWHIRYLGKSTARLVHDSGLALEEFLGVD